MRILGRRIRLRKLPYKFVEQFRMLVRAFQFVTPFRLLRSYLSFKSPNQNMYVLRSGVTLFLSSNPHDSVTVMVIFCRREYGRIPTGSVVVDIGANIGMFAVYAALNGARKVYAFEPNLEAYETLCRNIEGNKLGGVIVPFNLGVSEADGKKIYIPSGASPYNKTSTTKSDDLLEVNTLSLKTILHEVVDEKVDFLKIDCEGAEYEILFTSPDACFQSIRHIRMEHHIREKKDELFQWFSKVGFDLKYEQNLILWWSKR